MEAFNYFDYFILIIFGCSVLIGFGRGFVGEVVSLGTLVVAFFIAANFATPLANMFTSTQTVQGVVTQAGSGLGGSAAQSVSYVAIAISFCVIFIAITLIGAFFSYMLNLAMQTGMLGLGNRLLGALFGLIRGYVLSLAVVFVIQLTPIGVETWFTQSFFVNNYQPQVDWLNSIVSPAITNLKSRLGQTIQGVGSQLQGMVGQ